jgi:hypothetical protein
MRALTLLIMALCGASAAYAQDARPVMVGGEAALDACGGYGRVTGLDPNGHNALSVRTGPGTEFERRSKIGPDQDVWICETSGDWYGVIYTQTPDQDCGITSPIATRTAYTGPCELGWVYSKYILLLAG